MGAFVDSITHAAIVKLNGGTLKPLEGPLLDLTIEQLRAAVADITTTFISLSKPAVIDDEWKSDSLTVGSLKALEDEKIFSLAQDFVNEDFSGFRKLIHRGHPTELVESVSNRLDGIRGRAHTLDTMIPRPITRKDLSFPLATSTESLFSLRLLRDQFTWLMRRADYPPVLTILQSSWTGKSRLMAELKKTWYIFQFSLQEPILVLRSRIKRFEISSDVSAFIPIATSGSEDGDFEDHAEENFFKVEDRHLEPRGPGVTLEFWVVMRGVVILAFVFS